MVESQSCVSISQNINKKSCYFQRKPFLPFSFLFLFLWGHTRFDSKRVHIISRHLNMLSNIFLIRKWGIFLLLSKVQLWVSSNCSINLMIHFPYHYLTNKSQHPGSNLWWCCLVCLLITLTCEVFSICFI